MWGFSSRKNQKMPGAHKIGAAISGPGITGGNFMDTTLFLILKFSRELGIFKRATHHTPIFCGEFWRSGLRISSEIEIFKRD